MSFLPKLQYKFENLSIMSLFPKLYKWNKSSDLHLPAGLTFPKSTLAHHWTVKVELNVLGYEKWQASQNNIDSKSMMKNDVSLCS